MEEPVPSYVEIYADDDGTSHLRDVEVPFSVSPAEPGVAELWVGEPVPVDRLHVLTVKAAEQSPDWHCAPRRQFVVFLDGWTRITTSDGESRVLPAGSVALVVDTHGDGHVTEHEPGDRQVLVIPLDPPPA
jgi:hypothetical protein